MPEWLCAIIEKLHAKEPSERFQSAEEVAELLEGCLAHVQQPTSAPLPASLVPQATTGRSVFNVTRIGVLIMLGIFGMTLLGMVLWQATEPPDINGQWTSDEWGTVMLESKEPGLYKGTFSGIRRNEPTLSNNVHPATGGGIEFESTVPDYLKSSITYKGPVPLRVGFDRETSDERISGTIHLKWSRIERRYSGTWTKGGDPGGKISLRVVENEIRGAWTTNKNSKANRGTPKLGDLTWKRTRDLTPVVSATELEKLIQLAGRELFYGRMELTQEFKTLWKTKDQKRETVISTGTARWLKKGGMTCIESERMVPANGTIELRPEQWTTGQDGKRAYAWDRAAGTISYGTMRPGALAYAPNLFFWGRSGIAFPQPMFGLNPRIASVTRDGRTEIDVDVVDARSKSSVHYVGIVPSRGYLPTRVETRTGHRLKSQVELQDFFEPRPGVWAAKTIMWTAWSDDDDVDGKPILASRTKFTVTRLELGDDAQLQDEEFSLKLPDDVKVVDTATANTPRKTAPGEILVEIYGGRGIWKTQERQNEVGKLLLSLKAINGVTVDIHEDGEGDAVTKAVVHEPALPGDKDVDSATQEASNQAIKAAVREILLTLRTHKVPSVHWLDRNSEEPFKPSDPPPTGEPKLEQFINEESHDEPSKKEDPPPQPTADARSPDSPKIYTVEFKMPGTLRCFHTR